MAKLRLVFRTVINHASVAELVVGTVVVTLGVVLLGIWLIRRFVPATREGFDAEVSSQMLGVVASLLGLLLAFVIVIEYQNFGSAQDNVGQEADSLAAITRDSHALRTGRRRPCACRDRNLRPRRRRRRMAQASQRSRQRSRPGAT